MIRRRAAVAAIVTALTVLTATGAAPATPAHGRPSEITATATTATATAERTPPATADRTAPATATATAGDGSSPVDDPDEVVWATRPADNRNGTGRAFFDYILPPGETVDDAVEVENRGAEALTLQIYAADAYTTLSGTIDLAASSADSVDAGTWVDVSQPTVTIDPGQKVTVPFTVTVPRDAGPGDHPAGVVTSLTSGGGTTGMAVERRLGSRLYVRVPGNLSPSAAVQDISASYRGTLNPFAPAATDVTYRLTNTGNVRITPQESVTIRGLWGLITAAATAADPPDILPGSTIIRTVRVDGVWPTVLLGAAVTVTPTPSDGQAAGAAVTAAGSDGFWAVPWPQLVVLALLIALLVAWRLAVNRRRASVQRRIDAAVRAAHAEYDARS